MTQLGTQLLLSLALAGPVREPADRCTPAQAMAAETGIERAHRSWSELHSQYVRYARNADCDDGLIAEGWDDAVVRLLASRWEELPRLAERADADPGFRAFVLRHAGATADAADLERALGNAERRCPAGREALCADIRRQARAALTETGNEVRDFEAFGVRIRDVVVRGDVEAFLDLVSPGGLVAGDGIVAKAEVAADLRNRRGLHRAIFGAASPIAPGKGDVTPSLSFREFFRRWPRAELSVATDSAMVRWSPESYGDVMEAPAFGVQREGGQLRIGCVGAGCN